MNGRWAHIRWIGGSPCAGKSTIAKHLAEEFELNFYQCDNYWDAHTSYADLSDDSLLRRFKNMSYEQMFMRPVEVQLQTEIAVYQEEFPLILADLATFPTDKLLLVEGAALQPDLVVPLLTQPNHAIWIVPTEEFQRTTYHTRDWMHAIAEQTHDPETAIDNWMSRDARYARWIDARVKHHQQAMILVDGQQSIQHNTDIVRKRFKLSG